MLPMTRWTLLVALCTVPASALQDPPSGAPAAGDEASSPRTVVERIVSEGLRSPQAFAMLERLVAAAPKRLSGSPGLDAALEWGRAEMERAGLENVRLERCEVPHWERGAVEELVLLDDAGAVVERFAVAALGGSVATPPEGLEAEVVEVRDRAELETLGERARGKLLFLNQPMDATARDTFEAYGRAVWQRSIGAVEAARRGGVGAIVRSMTTRLDDLPHTGAMRYEDGVPQVPAVAISTIGASKLSERLARGPLRLRLRLECRTLADAPSANVVGELVGRELPDEVLLVGGHIDAWDLGVGAHDDGAGCAQSIEAARLIAASGLRPRRTIRVVLFTNEENGLAGARAYRAAHEAELERHVLALESDRGGFVPRGFTTDANPTALSILRSLAEPLASIGADTVKPGGGGADIGVLASAGVPLVGLLPDSQRYFDVHHCERDTLEQVSPRELELGAAAMAALLWQVAERAEPLPRNRPPEGSR
jgi:carboxypeptidase Q